MGKHLVFIGGGHAHLTALVRLKEYIQRGHKVTFISPSPYQYYSGMAPGMLSGTYRPQEVRFHVRKLAEDRGAEFIGDSVNAFHPRERVLSLKSGEKSPMTSLPSTPAAKFLPKNSFPQRWRMFSRSSPSSIFSPGAALFSMPLLAR